MPSVKLLHPVRHNGKLIPVGATITDLSASEFARLVSLEAIEAPEEEPALDVAGDGLEVEEDLSKLTRPQLIERLTELGVTAKGSETKAVLIGMVEDALAGENGEDEETDEE